MLRGLALMLILLVVAGCGGQPVNPDAANILSGRVTHKGNPVPNLTLVVSGPDGSKRGGSTNDQGEYRIPNPPQGKLSFQFIEAGRPGSSAIPKKYAQPNNGVNYDYTGGLQTFDIQL
jgi:hypothetical protein